MSRYDARVDNGLESGGVPERAALPSADLVPGTDAPLAGRGWRSRLRTVAAGVLGLVGATAFLASGLLLILALALTPNPGGEALVPVLKAADVVGWLAIGLWLLVDWWHLRLRVLVPPVAAWLWTSLLLGTMNGLAYLNWGY